MAIRKNKKRIDPRYFLNETTYRDEIEAGTMEEGFFDFLKKDKGAKAPESGPSPAPSGPPKPLGFKKAPGEDHNSVAQELRKAYIEFQKAEDRNDADGMESARSTIHRVAGKSLANGDHFEKYGGGKTSDGHFIGFEPEFANALRGVIKNYDPNAAGVARRAALDKARRTKHDYERRQADKEPSRRQGGRAMKSYKSQR